MPAKASIPKIEYPNVVNVSWTQEGFWLEVEHDGNVTWDTMQAIKNDFFGSNVTCVKAIKKIDRNFSWKFFSIVDVSEREGGVFAIIDSQHRVHGAAMAGMTHVPCLIHNMSLEEEAEAFAAINGNVVSMTNWSMYRASLVAGEQWAIAANKCVADAGCKLMTSNKPTSSKKGGEIFSIQDVRKKVEAGKSKELTFALKALRNSDHGDEPLYYTSPWLKAVTAAMMERYLRFQDRFEDVVKALSEIDFEVIEDKALDEIKRRRRTGMPSFSKWELMRSYLGTSLDKKLPVVASAIPISKPKHSHGRDINA